jgi:ribosome biogenesis GTPase / thiamine phosphate phosphatase
MLREGVVYRGNSGLYEIKVIGDDQQYSARLKGTLKKQLIYSTSGSRPSRVTSARKRRTTDPIAIGDSVVFDDIDHLIQEVKPRHSELARSSPQTGEQHVLVANLDTVFVVFAAAEPKPDLWLMDRFLVLVEAVDLAAEIIINKCDLLSDLSETTARMDPYVKAGYRIHYLSVRQEIGIEELRATLSGKISAFAGPSGVGKSSILNRIKPGLKLKTGDVGEVTFKGRHTTTTAELIPLNDQSSWVADTPGLRQIDFWEIDTDDLEQCFPEFANFLDDCQYTNCTHRTEPGCKIIAEVASGRIDNRRYRSFLQMLGEKSGKTPQ